LPLLDARPGSSPAGHEGNPVPSNGHSSIWMERQQLHVTPPQVNLVAMCWKARRDSDAQCTLGLGWLPGRFSNRRAPGPVQPGADPVRGVVMTAAKRGSWPPDADGSQPDGPPGRRLAAGPWLS
jgi:hypothetical protein